MARKSVSGTGTIRKKTVVRGEKKYTYWEARYTEGHDPGTGKQIQRSITGKTQKAVAEKMKIALAAIDAGEYIAPSKMTVAQWLEIWEKDYLGSVKPSTLHKYKGHIENHIKPVLGAIKLTSLQPHMVQAFINNCLKQNGEAGKVAPSTVRVTHSILNSALNRAMKLGYCKINAAAQCSLPRMNKREMLVFDDDQIKAFLSAIKNHPLEALFIVDLFTGMRKGEILGLTWDCVDFTAGIITVNKQLQINHDTGEYVFTSTKSGKTRTIMPAPWIMQVLKKRRTQQMENRLLAGPTWVDTGLVFTNEFGRYLIPQTVSRRFRAVVSEIGCDGMRFHDLRHSYAVASLRSGDDVKTLQENLGHASAKMTLDVYAHTNESMKKESASRMDGYIKQVLSL